MRLSSERRALTDICYHPFVSLLSYFLLMHAKPLFIKRPMYVICHLNIATHVVGCAKSDLSIIFYYSYSKPRNSPMYRKLEWLVHHILLLTLCVYQATLKRMQNLNMCLSIVFYCSHSVHQVTLQRIELISYILIVYNCHLTNIADWMSEGIHSIIIIIMM